MKRQLGFSMYADPSPIAPAGASPSPRAVGAATGAHDWENIKENAKPIKRGRRIAKLNAFARNTAGLSTTSRKKGLGIRSSAAAAKTERQIAIAQFEEQIAAAADDPAADRLEPWMRFIRWSEDEYPTGGPQSNLLILLERCCRALLKDEAYKNDERYVKVWLKYADLLEDPMDLFRFLCVNRVGERRSLFYVAWALVAEHRKNYSLADKVFSRGKRHGAKPSKMLDQRYRQFQRRMARKWLRQDEGDEDAAPTRLSEAGTDRRSTHRSNNENAGNGGRVGRGRGLAGGVANTRRAGGLGISRSRTSSSNNGRTGVSTLGNFNIFVEGEDGAAGGAAQTAGAGSGGVNDIMPRPYDDDIVDGSPSLPWNHFAGKKERKKENDGPVTRWNEGGLELVGRQRGRHSRLPRPPAFSICVDEEDGTTSSFSSSSSAAAACTTGRKATHSEGGLQAPGTANLRRRLEGPGRTQAEKEAHDLFKDPLKNFRLAGEDLTSVAADAPQIPAPPPPRLPAAEPNFAPPAPPLPAEQQQQAKAGRHKIRASAHTGYEPELLQNDDGEETCFEEQRAMLMIKRARERSKTTKAAREAKTKRELELRKQQQQQQQQRPPRVPIRRGGVGSAGPVSRKPPTFNKHRQNNNLERRATMATLRGLDDSSTDESDYSSSEEEEDSLLAGVADGNTSAAAPKALTFSNCDSFVASVSAKDSTVSLAVVASSSTPMPGISTSIKATRKLMFNSGFKASPSPRAANSMVPKPHLMAGEFYDSSDASSDDEQPKPTEAQIMPKTGGKRNVIGLNNEDMTCNLQAAMDELGDIFCSPGLTGAAEAAPLNTGADPAPAAATATGAGFKIYGGDDLDDTSSDDDEARDENAAPPNHVQPQFRERRHIQVVKPSAVMREMSPGEYPSALPTEQASDDEEQVPVGLTASAAMPFGGGFQIFSDETADVASNQTARESLARNLFDASSDRETETVAQATVNVLRAASDQLVRRERVDPASQHCNIVQQQAAGRRNTLEMIGSFEDSDESDAEEESAAAAEAGRGGRRQSLNLANTLDLLNLDNLDDSSDQDSSVAAEEEIAAAAAAGRRQRPRQPSRNGHDADRRTSRGTSRPAIKMSIFEDVFGKDQSHLQTISEGGSEASGSSQNSSGAHSNLSSRKGSSTHQFGMTLGSMPSNSTAASGRLSMDSMSSMNDLSSICCEDEADESGMGQAQTPAVVELPFKIFTD